MRELPKKTSHTEFTKGEFLEFLSRFHDPGSEEQNTAEILYFDSVVPHPEKKRPHLLATRACENG